jgi:formate-dependent nitrite reductase membrane component NrfD
MEQTIFYNVHHHEAMGLLIVVYFFLSGVGAGAFLTAAGCRIFGGPKYAKIEKTAAVAAPLLLIPGLLCLLADLGKPMRFFNLILYFNPASVASWGVWIINIFMFISLVYAFMHLTGRLQKAGLVAGAGLVFALLAALYSGMLLYQMRGHELWHSALVPALFLASAIASGLAVVLLLSVSAAPEQRRGLASVLAVAVGVDLVLALTELLTLAWGAGEKAELAKLVTSGTEGFLFIGVYLVLGLVVPLAVLSRQRSARTAQIAAALLVLAGTLAMRYVIVTGGQALPLS